MTNGLHGPGFNERPERSAETALIEEAISYAHQDIILADRRDTLLGTNKVEGSYRYVIWAQQGSAGIADDQATLRLIPNRRERPSASIKELYLRIPIKPTPQANSVLLDAHRTNIVENISDDLWYPGIEDPRFVPTNDVFGRAVKADGSSIDFLLNASGLHAYSFEEDIEMAGADEQLLYGQHYNIRPSLENCQVEADLAANWFSIEDLRDMLNPEAYEPDTHGASESNSAAS